MTISAAASLPIAKSDMTTSIKVALGRAHHCMFRRQRVLPVAVGRDFSSTANTNPPSSAKPPSPTPPAPQILDERTLLSQVSPLKRIVCLCPVPLGRGRVAWSGGASFYPESETINLDFRSHPQTTTQNIAQMQPLKVKRYRHGERFAIGVAVSDPYLTHALPVHLGSDGDGDDALKRRFVAEMVPTFRCDAHNMGPSPIFHTNLPYFRNDFLQHIGHSDIGAIVLAMPMAPSKNPFCPMPTKVQLEQEKRLVEVREHLLNVLQNYVSADEEEEDDFFGAHAGQEIEEEDAIINTRKRHTRLLGPLNLQGRIDHRLSITDVLSKTSNDCRHGNWDHISRELRQIQNRQTMGRTFGGGGSYFLGNQEYGSYNVFSSVPPEIHAAVALNAMMEEFTGGRHNSFF